MTKMDRDGNNTVDFEEFYYWYGAIYKITSRVYVAAAHWRVRRPLVSGTSRRWRRRRCS